MNRIRNVCPERMDFPSFVPLKVDTTGERTDFIAIKLIQKGATGSVYTTKNPETGSPRALKITIDLEKLNAARHESEMIHKAHAVGCRHIVHHLRTYEKNGNVHQVFELLGPDLFDLRCNHSISPDLFFIVAKQGLEALADLETKAGIINRDIKIENMSLHSKTNQIKIFDFDLATREVSSQAVGSEINLAPELWLGALGDSRIDVWSFGVALFTLVTKESFFYWNDKQQKVPASYEEQQWQAFNGISRRCGPFPAAFIKKGNPLISSQYFTIQGDVALLKRKVNNIYNYFMISWQEAICKAIAAYYPNDLNRAVRETNEIIAILKPMLALANRPTPNQALSMLSKSLDSRVAHFTICPLTTSDRYRLIGFYEVSNPRKLLCAVDLKNKQELQEAFYMSRSSNDTYDVVVFDSKGQPIQFQRLHLPLGSKFLVTDCGLILESEERQKEWDGLLPIPTVS